MTGWRADVVILSCAISAGIHGALIREHLAEGAGAGAGFAAATFLLAALAVALTVRPDNRVALVGAVLVFFGLLASYALAITTGVPLLHPDVEAVDGLALFTKGVETAGFIAGAHLLVARERRPHSPAERNVRWIPDLRSARFRSS